LRVQVRSTVNVRRMPEIAELTSGTKLDDGMASAVAGHEFRTKQRQPALTPGETSHFIWIGIEKENDAPWPPFGSAHNRPPCRSMMRRLTERPIPIPALFVV
jgi:hypothetical protein